MWVVLFLYISIWPSVLDFSSNQDHLMPAVDVNVDDCIIDFISIKSKRKGQQSCA